MAMAPSYCDTSSLLKMVWSEPESDAVGAFIANEEAVVVSELTLLEGEVQLKANLLSGKSSRAQHQRRTGHLHEILGTEPFRLRQVSGSLFEIALRQHRESRKLHCKSLDRLHLAAMEELGLRRLITHDLRLADAARALSFEVLMPGAI